MQDGELVRPIQGLRTRIGKAGIDCNYLGTGDMGEFEGPWDRVAHGTG